jgi:hypothetical protein
MSTGGFAVIGTTGVRLSPRAQVLDASSQPAPIAGLGATGVYLGASSSSGSVVSLANVSMDGQSTVFGTVQAAGTLTRQLGAIVTGKVSEHVVFQTSPAQVATLSLPASYQPAVNLEPGQSKTITAGSYGGLTVKTSAQLSMGPGTYVVSNFDLEPSGKLVLDNRNAAIELHVLSSLLCKGTFAPMAQTANLRIVYWGTNDVSLECNVAGAALIATNANVNVADRITAGSIIAATAQLGADAKVVAKSFHRFTSGPGNAILGQLDAAARTLACQRVDQYFGSASREIACRFQGLAAAKYSYPATDADARSSCLTAYQACMSPTHCNSVQAFTASCNVTVDTRDLCLEKSIPLRDAAEGNLFACNDLTIYRVYTFRGQQPLVTPVECLPLDACILK